MGFLAAFRFLTIIPLPGRRLTPGEIGRATAYFPAIGLIIGFILLGLNWVLNLILPPALVNILLLVSLAVISGGLHLDGFVDTCDGMVGHKTVAQRLRVMKDSRAGAFGIIGVTFLLLVKYAALSSVPALWLAPTLLLMPVLSRWSMVWAIFAFPYSRASGLGKAFKQGVSSPDFLVATLIALVIAVMPEKLFGLFIMFGVWVIVTALAFYFRSRFGGLTGDTYGAINEIAEVLVLLFVCLLAQVGWLG
jgi:adenosylcobinamide-GDP ribazoletransferase